MMTVLLTPDRSHTASACMQADGSNGLSPPLSLLLGDLCDEFPRALGFLRVLYSITSSGTHPAAQFTMSGCGCRSQSNQL